MDASEAVGGADEEVEPAKAPLDEFAAKLAERFARDPTPKEMSFMESVV